ncbi:MAG: binding-protein-dependent transport system inner rane component, partial [Myxococcales bacterium]|nr:binding-protein-dependent transport system inner rane component [Myxococcales bacterium]
MSVASREAMREDTSGAKTPKERGRKLTGRAPGEPRNVAYLYILPGLAAYVIFTLAPMVQTVHLSFYDWDGITPRRFVGVDNFRAIWDDDGIRSAFEHSVKLILFYAVFSIVIGLLLTAMLTRFRVRGFLFFRTVLFLPQTIATVVVAQAFVWFYDPSGPLNEGLRAIGLG